MVQSVITFSEKANRVLNIVKAKYGFKDKSEAMEKILGTYEEEFLEPELRPEFIEEMKSFEKEAKYTKFNNLDELREKIKNA
jgi:hypothetical protein